MHTICNQIANVETARERTNIRLETDTFCFVFPVTRDRLNCILANRGFREYTIVKRLSECLSGSPSIDRHTAKHAISNLFIGNYDIYGSEVGN